MSGTYFPIFVNVEAGAVLVVGGGENAARKVRLLLQARARVRVVALHAIDEIESHAEEERIELARRPVSQADIAAASFVISATGVDSVDRFVSTAAQCAGVKVNVVDRPELSDFIIPSIVDRSPVLVAIGTGAAAPVLARQIRERIEALLPPGLGRVAAYAEGLRGRVRDALPDPAGRRRFWERFFRGRPAVAVLSDRAGEAAEAVDALLDETAQDRAPRGRVVIVGAGPGAADLLTLRALRALQEADVIVHDALVGPEVLDLARRDAVRLYVGKLKNRHSHSQERINGILIEEARKGSTVVRLKGGDPFVFGRGGEEVEALRAAGVSVDVVPGITAATGAAAALRLPLTHRAEASVLSLATGHPAAGSDGCDLAALANPNQTAVIYMGRSRASAIAGRLIALGRSAETPVAVIENATLPEERVLSGTLDTLPLLEELEELTGPTLIVIGEVVARADLAHAEDLQSAVCRHRAERQVRLSA